jgi:lipopolysaccharide transport system ATP-binding protein
MSGERNVAIRLSDVSVRYRKRFRLPGTARHDNTVLDGVNLDVYHGESLGVIGRNGAGKSTLLKLLGGLILPDSGSIHHYVKTVSLLSIQVGFIPHLTGRDNAILSGILLGMSRDFMESRIEQIRDFSGLGDYFDERMECYSAGMRSRLGFSTAINIDPDVLLLDEILAVGDAEFKEKSRQVILEKVHSDATVILVSHSPSLVEECCSRAIWIDGGVVKAEGDVNPVLEAYKHG